MENHVGDSMTHYNQLGDGNDANDVPLQATAPRRQPTALKDSVSPRHYPSFGVSNNTPLIKKNSNTTVSSQLDQKQQFDTKRFSGASQMLASKWRGPFQITEALRGDRCEVPEMPERLCPQTVCHGVAGVENMKPWVHLVHDD